MNYESLLDEAHQDGLVVKEKPLKYNNGRIKGIKIAIRNDIDTTTEKSCILAEELGHYYTTTGNILDQSVVMNRKQEHRARLWAYDKMIGLNGLISAAKAGCQSQYEIAEYLEITEEFLSEALAVYRQKYGLGKLVDNYWICFTPTSQVYEYSLIDKSSCRDVN